MDLTSTNGCEGLHRFDSSPFGLLARRQNLIQLERTYVNPARHTNYPPDFKAAVHRHLEPEDSRYWQDATALAGRCFHGTLTFVACRVVVPVNAVSQTISTAWFGTAFEPFCSC